MGIGLDFGTTNSSIALATSDRNVSVARFRTSEADTESFRSLLYLERIIEAGKSKIKSWSGPAGIEHYLGSDDKGRLVQSLKSFLASRSLTTTEVFGRRFPLEALIANILRDIRESAERFFATPIRDVVVGRPVRFVGANSPHDDEYALKRLTTSLTSAGFERISYEYEPVGAAYHYESSLDEDELILIGDFGGGTSDFSLLRVGPSMRKRGDAQSRVLGNEGVPLAGDAFDAKIIRRLVSPALGAGTHLNSGGKILPVPAWVYFKLERWHHLSLLRSADTLNMLRSIAVQALERDKLNALLYLVKHDLGYHLHQSVQRSKVELSDAAQSTFQFVDGDLVLTAGVTRSAFETWIAEDLDVIEQHIHRLLRKTGVKAAEVDKVFLTGGSSFVPAVRGIFVNRFGASKIRAGSEFTSVARGLALRSLDN